VYCVKSTKGLPPDVEVIEVNGYDINLNDIR
jgi:hypothetical protein